jgi:hypothetical protein
MKIRSSVLVGLLIVTMISFAFGADIDGNWKGAAQGQMPIEQTFAFKAVDGKITGTVSDQMLGEAKITEGTLKGDDISFAVSANSQQMGQMSLSYKGKVTGADAIKLTMSLAGGAPGGGGGQGGPPGGRDQGGGPGGGGGQGGPPGGDQGSGSGGGGGMSIEMNLSRVK